MTIQEKHDRWFGASKYCQVVFPARGWAQMTEDGFRAGYLAALEDAAKACELQMMAEDGLPEADAACAACAAAVRALGNS